MYIDTHGKYLNQKDVLIFTLLFRIVNILNQYTQ